MSTNLQVEKAQIKDDLNQLAATCKVTVRPTKTQASPAVEFSFPQDVPGSQNGNLTNLRPAGSQVGISAVINGVMQGDIFFGTVEFLDDMTDANQYEYTIDMSKLPVGFPNRTRFSQIFNSFETVIQPTGSGDTQEQVFGVTNTSLNSVGAVDLLQQCCNIVGIPLGRCDLPNYAVSGTFEIIRKNVIEVARELCDPYNHFDFQHYYVRCDQSGLSIIFVDYTMGMGEGGPAYVVSKAKSVKRTFEVYMPDNRVGNADVLITGAHVTGIVPPKAIPSTSVQPTTNEIALTQTFFQSTENDTFSAASNGSGVGAGTSYAPIGTAGLTNVSSSPPLLTNWSETTTTMAILIEFPSTTSPQTTLDGFIGAYQIDRTQSFRVKESYTLSTVTDDYTSAGGQGNERTLLKHTDTENNYQMLQFSTATSQAQPINKRVLVSRQTTVTQYANGHEVPTSMDVEAFFYTSTGELYQSLTQKFVFIRNTWVLIETSSDIKNDLNIATAGLVYSNKPATANPSVLKSNVSEQSFKVAQMYTIQLYNGIDIYQYEMNFLGPLTSPPGGLDPVAPPLNLAFLDTRLAFTIHAPFMLAADLQAIWILCLREKTIETLNPYWEMIEIECPADFTPMVGEPVIVTGYAGIAEKVEHVLDANSAITKISLKRLVLLGSLSSNPDQDIVDIGAT